MKGTRKLSEAVSSTVIYMNWSALGNRIFAELFL